MAPVPLVRQQSNNPNRERRVARRRCPARIGFYPNYVRTGWYRFVRPGNAGCTGLKTLCPLTKLAALPKVKQGSIKGPISVPVSPSSAVKCYPCR
jgi:hypothetical protein